MVLRYQFTRKIRAPRFSRSSSRCARARRFAGQKAADLGVNSGLVNGIDSRPGYHSIASEAAKSSLQLFERIEDLKSGAPEVPIVACHDR
jgi:hypothetical protein